MTLKSISRRRFLGLTAVAVGAAAVPFFVHRRRTQSAQPVAAKADVKKDQPFIWRGIALSADSQLYLYHTSPQEANRLIALMQDEVMRLEKIFSLYNPNTEIRRLNREGRLKNPSSDLLTVLSISRDIYERTKGAFDPTIQPLWDVYAKHFAQHPHTEVGPDPEALKKAVALVDFNKVHFDTQSVYFDKPGMALSLNGINQGYTTDRITELLRSEGVKQALIDMGEIRGLAVDHDRTWEIGIRNPKNEKQVKFNISIQNQALGTSGGYGTTLDEGGKFTHLFDPKNGNSKPRYLSVSVEAQSTALADALSTAFSVCDETVIADAVKKTPNSKAWLIMPDGSTKTFA